MDSGTDDACAVHSKEDTTQTFPNLGTKGRSLFKDGNIVDFILVIKRNEIDIFEPFLHKVEECGLLIEVDLAKKCKDLLYLKFHAPAKVLIHYVKVYKMELSLDSTHLDWPKYDRMKFFHTPMTWYEVDPELAARTDDNFGETPKVMTNAERIMIVESILANPQYYNHKFLCNHTPGYKHPLYSNYIVAAYPVHEGSWRWDNDGPFNPVTDRQLLHKYWGQLINIFKYQPLPTIKKYFGTEIAFFYGFLGFYNYQLIPVAICGLIFWALSFVHLASYELSDFCKIEYPLCPTCANITDCPIMPVSQHCTAKAINILFDNNTNALFAVMVSIWSCVFYAKWRNYKNLLRVQWNVAKLKYDNEIRYEYLAKATVETRSRFTGIIMKEVSCRRKAIGYVMTYLSFIILLVANYLGIFFMMLVYKVSMLLMPAFPERSFIVSLFTAIFQFSLLALYIQPGLQALSVYLASKEYHRTERQYEDSIIYKTCVLTIPTFYGVGFYMSLFKGKFFSDPNMLKQWYSSGGLPADQCNPAGCMADVSIYMLVLLITNTFVGSLKVIGKEYFILIQKRMKNNRKWEEMRDSPVDKPRSVCDFFKNQLSEYYLNNEYTDIMIHYAMLTFFISTTPLIPLLIFIRNGIMLRLTAFKLLLICRRPVPKRIPDIAAWTRVLAILTILGFLTNSVMLGFCSSIISRAMHFYRHQSMRDYSRSTFISTEISELIKRNIIKQPINQTLPESCYYRGYDTIPMSSNLNSFGYWEKFVNTLIFILVLENILLLIMGLVLYLCPSMSDYVKAELDEEQNQIRLIKINMLNERIQATTNKM